MTSQVAQTARADVVEYMSFSYTTQVAVSMSAPPERGAPTCLRIQLGTYPKSLVVWCLVVFFAPYWGEPSGFGVSAGLGGVGQ